MYTVKNVGTFPIIIRDLNLHISGGKIVDLDSLFKQDTIRRSVDLQKLLDKGKLFLVEKKLEKIKPKSFIPTTIIKNDNQHDSKILTELKKDLGEIKDLLKSGSHVVAQTEGNQVEYDEETRKKITNLQVKNLSDGMGKAKKNFDKMGESTEKQEKLDNLLDVLDSLEKGG